MDFPLTKVYPGKKLKEDLGLGNFRSVVIRKIINVPLHIFLVYFNSRFPNTYIPIARIKTLETMTVKRLMRQGGDYQEVDFRMTPPMDILHLTGKLPSNSIIIKIDITGEYFANKKLYKRKK